MNTNPRIMGRRGVMLLLQLGELKESKKIITVCLINFLSKQNQEIRSLSLLTSRMPSTVFAVTFIIFNMTDNLTDRNPGSCYPIKAARNSTILSKLSGKTRMTILGSFSVVLWSLNESRLNLSHESQNLSPCTACGHKPFFVQNWSY